MSALPNTARLMKALDATWPAADQVERDGWLLRRGDGGGNRVSAATSQGGSFEAAEAAMRAMDQTPLIRLTPGEEMLDEDLAARGWSLHEPTVLYAGKASALEGEGEHTAGAYRAKIRPAIMEEVWQSGGIGPERWAIMERVKEPALFLLGRVQDRPCGAAFVAVDGDIAMIHAIEVQPEMRRKGVATLMLEAAARFARDVGAATLSLAVTEANANARALYERQGMERVGGYHYRIKKT